MIAMTIIAPISTVTAIISKKSEEDDNENDKTNERVVINDPKDLGIIIGDYHDNNHNENKVDHHAWRILKLLVEQGKISVDKDRHAASAISTTTGTKLQDHSKQKWRKTK